MWAARRPEIVEVVRVDDQCRLCLRPFLQPLETDEQQLRLDESRRSRHLGVGCLGAAETRHGARIGRLDGVAQESVGEHPPRPARELVAGLQRLDDHGRAFLQPAPERGQGRQVGEHGLQLGLPCLDGPKDACVVPRGLDRRRAAWSRHSGMLPCLRLGVGSRLARCSSSAVIR